jgi:hypothetical protein
MRQHPSSLREETTRRERWGESSRGTGTWVRTTYRELRSDSRNGNMAGRRPDNDGTRLAVAGSCSRRLPDVELATPQLPLPQRRLARKRCSVAASSAAPLGCPDVAASSAAPLGSCRLSRRAAGSAPGRRLCGTAAAAMRSCGACAALVCCVCAVAVRGAHVLRVRRGCAWRRPAAGSFPGWGRSCMEQPPRSRHAPLRLGTRSTS